MSKNTSQPRLIRFPEVKSRTGIDSRQHARKLAERGEFPAPVTFGKRAIAWVDAEIDEWVRQRIAERQAAAGAQTVSA
jgi:prophage regulatory protein